MIKIGNTVLCRYYNTPEGKFYGEHFKAEIVATHKRHSWDAASETSFQVKRLDTGYVLWLHRNEIKRKVKD